MLLWRMQKRKGDQRDKGKNSQCSHCMFFVVDDNSRADESSYSEEKVEQLDPEVLSLSDEQLKDTEVAKNVHHAA